MTTACMEDSRQLYEKERAAGKQTMEGHMVLEDIIQLEANRQVEDNRHPEDIRQLEVKSHERITNSKENRQLKDNGQMTTADSCSCWKTDNVGSHGIGGHHLARGQQTSVELQTPRGHKTIGGHKS